MTPERLLVLGAAGRDFHNFNVVWRDDPAVRVVAFTGAQVPGIAGRRYPASLAGPRYPDGIPILDEGRLEAICRDEVVTAVVFAYSDVEHAEVMHRASRALACGADFLLLGPARTMLAAPVPVIAVSGVRTGVGKSPIARWLAARLRGRGRRVGVLRHPMPYGDLEKQRVQRFASIADLVAAGCTLEEREEYEPHLAAGNVVFTGVETAAVLEAAAAEADLIVWDGGNNDFPFVRPDLHLAVVDALRPGHATTYHPGETVLRMADVVVISKVDAASSVEVATVAAAVRAVNPRAIVVRGASPIRVVDPAAIRGRRVLVVEDGPTITHGGMPHGAGFVAATAGGVREIVDPRRSAIGPVADVFRRHPHIGRVLPSLGYDPAQLDAMRTTIDGSDAEVVVAATPVDLAALIPLRKPVVRVHYEFAEVDGPGLGAVVDRFLAGRAQRRS